MILVTVGMQLGFDRLIRTMDIVQTGIGIRFVAQTGKGTYQPENMEARRQLSPAEFAELAEQAALIVSHAGIGTVLTARRLGKPIVLLPRRASLGEHRNDHQIATAKALAGRPGILVAMDETELPGLIVRGLAIETVEQAENPGLASLSGEVARFIANE